MTTRQPVKGLVFYPRSHRYKLDGQWVQGVTTIINQGLPKSALLDWYARSAAEYAADHRDALWSLGRDYMVAAVKIAPHKIRDAAAKRGKLIHHHAELILKGGEVEVPEEIAGFVESAVAFMDDWRIEPLVVERPVASRKHKYGGTLDLVAESFGEVGIFDFKSGDSGVWGETALQNKGYAGSEFYLDDDGNEQPTAGLGIEASYGVHLRADGYTVYPLQFGQQVWRDFLTVRANAAVAKRVKDYVLDPVEPPAEEKVA